MSDIRIGIGADVQPALNGIKQVQLGVSKLGDSIETLRAKLLAKKEFINVEKDINRIAVLNKEIQELEGEIERVQNIGKKGFNELGIAVDNSTGKMVSGLNNAFGSIRKLAYILPGIGIAGIFSAAFEGVQKLVDALASANFGVPKFKDLISSVEGAKDEFVKASVTVETLKNEIQLAKEGFISKNEVVKKYNDTIGRTTGFVKTLDEAERELTKNGDAYIQFTLLKAAANIALAKSADLAFQAALQNKKDLERISKITADKEGIGEFIKSGEENLRKAEQETFGKRVDSLKDIASNFLKEAGEIKKKFNFDFFDEAKKQTVEKGLTEIQRNLIQLAKEAEKAFNVPLKLRFDDTDLDVDKLKKAQQVLAGIKDFTIKARVDIKLPDPHELPKEKVEKFFVDTLDPLKNGLQKGLFDVPIGFKPEDLKPDAFAKEIEAAIAKFNNNSIEIPIDVQIRAAKGEKGADFLKDLIKSFDIANKVKQEVEIINNALIDAFSAVGEGLGNAISGGGIKNFFSGIFQVIGEGLKQLGRFVITSSTLIKNIKTALNAALAGNPVAGLAVGVGLIALGTAIQKSLPKFAEGGIVNKPTLGIFGEAGPEVVMPLDKLKSLIGGIAGNNINVGGDFRLSGNDLVLALNRTNRTQGRGG